MARNWALGLLAFAFWAAAYGWYFGAARRLRAWWAQRSRRG